MPTYRFRDTETGEIFEKWMYMADRLPYLEENPHIKQMPTELNIGEVGEWKNKLIQSKPGWNQVLEKASKAPGSRVTKI